MTSAREAPIVASAAKVHEFTTDLVVQRRHAAADGVVALDLVHPGSPGPTSISCSPRGWSASIRCAGIHAMPKRGGSASCSTHRAAAVRVTSTSTLSRAAPCRSGGLATILSSSTHRAIC